MAQLWEIVGGGDQGGVMVRDGLSCNSGKLGERLSTGSLVEEKALEGDRLHYLLRKGSGPPTGWITVKLPHKDLAVRTSAALPDARASAGPGEGVQAQGGAEAAGQPQGEPPSSGGLPGEGAEGGEDAGGTRAGRWNPRCGEAPPPEAPFAKSLADLTPAELAAVPRTKWTLKGLLTFKQFKENVNKQLPGAHYGMIFPHTWAQLRDAGAPWLTQAFHAAGTLPPDNRVTGCRVTVLSDDSCGAESMGGQGMKGLLSLEYEKPHPMLHTEMFVKLPFPYEPTNERQKNSHTNCIDEPEILFNRLMGPLMPFRIPKYYFGEFSYESSNYILISEKIEFSETSWAVGGQDMKLAPYVIEPHVQKFKDHLMPRKGYEQWLAVMVALGKMVAAFHTGKLGDQGLLRELFVTTGGTSPFAWQGWDVFRGHCRSQGGRVSNNPEHVAFIQAENDQALAMASSQAALILDFVTNAPQLFPKELSRITFLKKWFKEAMEIAYYSNQNNMYCTLDPAFLTMVHPNLCSDNAWFWRDDEGALQCGILDWGAAMLQPLHNTFGCLCQADYGMLTDHEKDLVHGFVDSARSCGAPESITFDTLFQMIKLSQGGVGGTTVIQLYKMQKKEWWAKQKDFYAPEIFDRFLPRNYVGGLINQLAAYRYRDVYGAFRKWREENQHWFALHKEFVCPDFPSN